MTLHTALRYSIALLLAPILTAIVSIFGAYALVGAPGDSEEARIITTFGLMIGYFVELLNFLPLYGFARRCFPMSIFLSAALGAASGWFAPLSYMLLMGVWRGDALNAFVLRASDFLLSPWLAVFGALGGMIFFLLVREPSRQGASRAQRGTVVSPVSGLSGS